MTQAVRFEDPAADFAHRRNDHRRNVMSFEPAEDVTATAVRDRAKAADDADRATVDRLVHSAWFTANRPNLSWETHAREVAAALAEVRAAERGKADALRAAMHALAEELEAWQDNAVRFAAHTEGDAVTGAMARARAMAYGRAIDSLRAIADGQR